MRLIFCPPPFQPSQCWLQIVVVMLFCSMLEINDVVLYCIVLYCIVGMHLHGLYQHFIPRNLFAYIITDKYHQDGGYRRAHVKIIT